MSDSIPRLVLGLVLHSSVWHDLPRLVKWIKTAHWNTVQKYEIKKLIPKCLLVWKVSDLFTVTFWEQLKARDRDLQELLPLECEKYACPLCRSIQCLRIESTSLGWKPHSAQSFTSNPNLCLLFIWKSLSTANTSLILILYSLNNLNTFFMIFTWFTQFWHCLWPSLHQVAT